jgi:photosystem II stability/assembly factor-like uncharacterized protein
MSPRTCILAVLLLAAGAARALPPPWVPLGPFGGYVQSLTADPTRSGTVYAITSEEVFKTADGGDSWTTSLLATSPLEWPTSNVAVDAVHSSTLYVGVRDPERRSAEVLKSTDGGAQWTPSSLGLPRTPFAVPVSVAVDPSDPRRLLVAYFNNPGSLWRSTDAGASWQPSTRGLPSSFFATQTAFAARPAGTAFAATSAGLFRTADAGLSWKRVDRGLPVAAVDLLALAPSDPRTVYVYIGALGLYRTADGGFSWQRVSAPSSVFGAALAVSPRSPRTLYASNAAGALFRSTDGGARWTALPGASGVTSLAFDAGSPQRIYAGTLPPPLGGVLRSDDGGASWTRRNQGMTGLETPLLAVDPQDSDRLWTTTVWNTLFRSANRGTRWARAGLPGPIPSSLDQLAVGASSALLAAVPFRIPPGPTGPAAYSLWKTADDGASWKQVLDTLSFDLFLLRVAPSDPSTIYAQSASLGGGTTRLYRSTDNGETWEPRSSGSPGLLCGYGDLAVAPSSAAVLYRASAKFDATSHCQGGVSRSDDGGATWVPADAGLPDLRGGIAALAVDPRDPDRVYAGTVGDGVWKSTDGGRSWSPTGAELAGQNILTLLVSAVPDRLYTVLGGRVFRSDDGGATWQVWSRGLRVTFIDQLVADPGDPRRIYVTTSNGVWALTETD